MINHLKDFVLQVTPTIVMLAWAAQRSSGNDLYILNLVLIMSQEES